MSDFDLYYWPVPFRGEFIRAILAFSGKTWTEHDAEEIGEIMARAPDRQDVPFMGPPVLVDNSQHFAIAQMPAIAFYLAETLDLLPTSRESRAATIKVVNDANDVIDELTLDGGREMWTQEKWRDFTPRLGRWMEIWEATGRKHGLGEDGGTLLGSDNPGLADIVTAVLWSTMSERFGRIRELLHRSAPCVASLTNRMMRMPSLARLSRTSRERYADAYCGGEIEKSLRKVAT
ncbi:glutathione S-transferase [Novosphingobium lindaniclasticum]|uniref:GST N-terminal domain-containing protein n=1 Tax=Novosphingobium lindaniclasticum LE124 TaxID=1096930 RepID=T0IZP0_9SPHN|nr:hypothetical protein [Novosphingobium lindaniclasticum]EQB15164.1 hypothetical protein L284_11045 [Novosphingobium lindaniclasticum LE124]